MRALRPAAGYLRYLKFFFWLALVPGDILPLIGWVAVAAVSPVLALVAVPFLFALVAPDVVAYVGIHLRYDTTWYVFTDRSLRIRRGILSIHETTISFENVQNVEVRQGPVQRSFRDRRRYRDHGRRWRAPLEGRGLIVDWCARRHPAGPGRRPGGT